MQILVVELQFQNNQEGCWEFGSRGLVCWVLLVDVMFLYEARFLCDKQDGSIRGWKEEIFAERIISAEGFGILELYYYYLS